MYNFGFRLLNHKLHIETLDDLAERLRKILERDITLKTVSSTTFEDKALDDVLQKVREVRSSKVILLTGYRIRCGMQTYSTKTGGLHVLQSASAQLKF